MDVAVLVDGCRPIGARVRRIPEPELRLVSLGGTLRGEAVAELVCRELEDLRDYCQPHAPGEVAPAPLVSLSCWERPALLLHLLLSGVVWVSELVVQQTPALISLYFQGPCSKLPSSAPRSCSSPRRNPCGPS